MSGQIANEAALKDEAVKFCFAQDEVRVLGVEIN
jgi:hypothetical protein